MNCKVIVIFTHVLPDWVDYDIFYVSDGLDDHIDVNDTCQLAHLFTYDRAHWYFVNRSSDFDNDHKENNDYHCKHDKCYGLNTNFSNLDCDITNLHHEHR